MLAKYDLECLTYHSSSLNRTRVKHLYPMCTIFITPLWYILLDVHIWQGHQHSLQKCFTIKCNCKWNQRVIEVYSWQTPCNHAASPPFQCIFHYIVSLTHSVLISPHMGSLVAGVIAFITKLQSIENDNFLQKNNLYFYCTLCSVPCISYVCNIPFWPLEAKKKWFSPISR